ncbi:hypothetical protein ACL02T_32320 [Pseudonocardia sp. RS010]|uniref:hypothetical protein n=1 Tax=Pseudonocardia sp. RS010 TaxID=3385979 RepID=UPI0039A32F8B
MMSELALLPSARTLRRWDLAAVLVAAVFTVLGVLAGIQIWQVADLHLGVLSAADALDATARAVGSLGQVPFVGSQAAQLADEIRGTAQQAREGALAARGDVQSLAVLVALIVVALGLLPGLLVVLPVRIARGRELRGLRRRLAGTPDPTLAAHLAHAALRRVPYQDLLRVSAQPWRDVAEERHQHLAAAELRRLGVRPPDAWAGSGHPAAPPVRQA